MQPSPPYVLILTIATALSSLVTTIVANYMLPKETSELFIFSLAMAASLVGFAVTCLVLALMGK